MRKLFTMLGLFAIALMLFTSCTENQMVKSYGGTATVDLPAGQKLVNLTWKEADLWILTRPAKPGEVPETYTFAEKSTYGVFQGTYVIKETLLISDLHVDPGSTTEPTAYITVNHQFNLKNAEDLIRLHEDPGNEIKLKF
jgi:hypothetical protein